MSRHLSFFYIYSTSTYTRRSFILCISSIKNSSPLKVTYIIPIIIYWFPVFWPILALIAVSSLFFLWSPRKKARHIAQWWFCSVSHSKIHLLHQNAVIPFACGPASMQMILNHSNITLSQEDIIALNGKSNFGMWPWEMTKVLTMIFGKHWYRAKVYTQNFSSLEFLQNELSHGRPCLVSMTMKFYEKHYPTCSYYPHYVVVTHIDCYYVWVQSSFSEERHHGESSSGEIRLSIADFCEQFYGYPSALVHLALKPVTGVSTVRKWRNIYLNFWFRWYWMCAYLLRILKPWVCIVVGDLEKTCP